MLSAMPTAILVGTVLGFLSGLGVGGGSLLILWLTFILQTEPQIARCINLLFFLPSALAASLFHIRRGKLKGRIVIPAGIAGCAAAILSSLLSGILNIMLMKKLFGILLLFTGLRALFYRPRKAK